MTAVAQFVAAVSGLSFENVFNPYTDRCAVFDRPGAPLKRREAFRGILAAAASGGTHSIWIGRDLGYRGGRRTGLALTDDVHVSSHAARWGIVTERCTKGMPVREKTAGFAWSVLDEIDLPVFLWNVFPLHPHEPGVPFSNRPHRANERAAGEEMLADMLDLLHPELIVALGGDAARCAERIAPRISVRVRHPSYGGQTEFLGQMSALYPTRPRKGRSDLFDVPL